MNSNFRQCGWAICSVLAICACMLASALAQQEPGTRSGTPTASPSDFEVKINPGELLVRRRGTLEWKHGWQFSEPIAVGVLDRDRNVYVVTKAIKPPKIKHTQDPGLS